MSRRLRSRRNEKDDYADGDKIKVIFETRNLVGYRLSFNLNDARFDFKHRDFILENDTIKDYPIQNNVEEIELTVIKQQQN